VPLTSARAARLLPLLLSVCALGTPPLIAQIHPAPSVKPAPSFEVAAIKPCKPDDPHTSLDIDGDRFNIEHMSLRDLIMFAYGLKSKNQVIGGPKWATEQYFNIAAKESDDDVLRLKALSGAAREHDRQTMMQALLKERFALQATEGTRKLPAFALLQAKGGAKLRHSPSGGSGSNLSSRGGHLHAIDTSIADFAGFLSSRREFSTGEVVDKTNLHGNYDFSLNWSPQYRLSAYASDTPEQASSTDDLPELIPALREQLGLVIKRDKEPIQVVIIDSASEPTPN
jgi:uncharacterized protein (TIGR03435 family)